MSSRLHSLIHILSDGRFHSGEQLGESLGVSRAAVWKMIPKLEVLGLEVYAVSGKGYRLSVPFEPLQQECIVQQLHGDSQGLLGGVEIFDEIESTNRHLLQRANEGAATGTLCLAEFQHNGRGRRGRNWASPYGSNIYLSLLWRFNDGTARLGGLSLAVAVALMRLLTELGVEKAGIKWPNDILLEGKKLAGILLDVAGESDGPCHVVIGVGLNFRMAAGQATVIDQPWTDLYQAGVDVGRNEVAGRLVHHLLLTVMDYQRNGLAVFVEEWLRWDLTRDSEVAIVHGNDAQYGIARGIDERGMLLVESASGTRSYASGEVSLRKLQ